MSPWPYLSLWFPPAPLGDGHNWAAMYHRPVYTWAKQLETWHLCLCGVLGERPASNGIELFSVLMEATVCWPWCRKCASWNWSSRQSCRCSPHVALLLNNPQLEYSKSKRHFFSFCKHWYLPLCVYTLPGLSGSPFSFWHTAEIVYLHSTMHHNSFSYS